ncbi:HAMP domain-containing histidine kinase [Candidatus Gracilibacteria bacterium]|nr:HAMP domain-containing histidine kinase [Candidatus Gracilibacteria bacterium]
MEIINILTALNGIIAIAIGIFALWKNSQNLINRSFALLAFSLGVWKIATILPFDARIGELIAFGGIVFAITANLNFYQALAGVNKRELIIGEYVLAFVFWAIEGLAFFRKDLLAIFDFLTLNHQICLFAGIFAIGAPVFLLVRATREVSGVKKYQLKFAALEYFTALLFVGIALTLNFDDKQTISANILNAPSLLAALHLLLVFYFFVEYKFLKLKIIAPNFLKKLIAFGFTIAVTLNLPLLVDLMNWDIPEKTTSILVIAIAVLFYNFTLYLFDAKKWFEAVSLENFRKAVDEFKDKNIFYASVDELQHNVQINFCPSVGIKEAQVVVLNLDGGTAEFPQLEKYFIQNSNYLITAEEEYLQKNKNIKCPYLAELKKLGDVCFPLFQHTNELIGFFVIRKSVGDDIYLAEELKLLEGSVHYIALSLMGILYTKKLREQAEKLLEDYERLKTLDDAKDAFIANVSHELRTPATAIKGYADLLASPNFGKLAGKQKDFANRIEKNTSWLLALLKDILEITKLESEQIEFKFATVAARKFLETLANKWKKSFKKKGLNFRIELEKINPQTVLLTDSKRLEEILDRCLTNARKFTEKGSITFEAQPKEEFLEIKVRDTGIGIPTKKLENIWDKFSQSTNFLEKGDQGTGLGLAIIKKLVENLDGEVSVQSELGKGSTFTLLIPLQHERQ